MTEEAVDTVYKDGTFAAELQEKCRLLLQELEAFQSHLKFEKKEHTVELRVFKNDVQNELKLLTRLVSLC